MDDKGIYESLHKIPQCNVELLGRLTLSLVKRTESQKETLVCTEDRAAFILGISVSQLILLVRENKISVELDKNYVHWFCFRDILSLISCGFEVSSIECSGSIPEAVKKSNLKNIAYQKKLDHYVRSSYGSKTAKWAQNKNLLFGKTGFPVFNKK